MYIYIHTCMYVCIYVYKLVYEDLQAKGFSRKFLRQLEWYTAFKFKKSTSLVFDSDLKLLFSL